MKVTIIFDDHSELWLYDVLELALTESSANGWDKRGMFHYVFNQRTILRAIFA